MRLLKKTSKEDLLYFDDYGILRFDLGGKIMLLFTVEIVALWVAFMLLGRWKYFQDSIPGQTILGLDISFLATTFLAITTKGKLINIYHTEISKQISNIIFFVMIFLILVISLKLFICILEMKLYSCVTILNNFFLLIAI